jgi:hypothetical protein
MNALELQELLELMTRGRDEARRENVQLLAILGTFASDSARAAKTIGDMLGVTLEELAADGEGKCRVCGCTDTTPCVDEVQDAGFCEWAKPDLCTACAKHVEGAAS